MATRASTMKTKPDKQNHTRSRSLDIKPKPTISSEPKTNADVSYRRINEKPLPNYLKPTISSRPDPAKFLKKNNTLEENQKLLRRRSFDRPLSSLTCSSSLSSWKSPNISPRDIPMIPLSPSITGRLRGSSREKSLPIVSKVSPGIKKTGLRSKKEGSKNVPKKSSDKEITPEDKGVLINEDKPGEPSENIEENNIEDKEEGENKILDEEEETTETETQESKEVVQGDKISLPLYNDVIASKVQDLEKMNVMAFAKAFQTVIDYETAGI